MAEYIEREALLKKMEKWHTKERLIDCVKDTPAADVVEVVRCKDCRFYKPTEKHWGNVCVRQTAYKRPNDYCSKGKRKEDNK